MKIYIAGKITGVPDYMRRFSEAEHWLRKMYPDAEVINPAKVMWYLPTTTEYRTYIRVGLSMLDSCDTIFMLRNWAESKGASLELQYALTMSLEIMYEPEE